MSATAEAGRAGRIVTFYSYKGGTGRTMALANVAWLLATNGFKVLTIDWDLESPGLHRYFHPFLKDKELRHSEGLLDLIRSWTDASLRATGGRPEPPAPRIQEFAASLDWNFPRGGLIDFVPAGRQDLGYTEAVSTFDWDSFWHQRHGNRLLDALREDMIRNYDVVLIDSRTGTSDTGGICTVQLPDSVVNCFTLNTQSIEGAVAVTRSILEQAPEIQVYPVPTRIEHGEMGKLERGRNHSRRGFEPYLTFLGDQSADAYWNSVEVPYIPYYAYEEVLAVFGDVPQQKGPLLDPYVRLAGLLAGRDCPAAVIGEADRARVLNAYEQTGAQDMRRIVVAYAPLDRIWAEWLRDRLSAAGHRVSMHSIRDSVPELDTLDNLVIVYSRDLVGREGGRRLLRQASNLIAGGARDFATLLRVDATPLEHRFPPRVLVDVMGPGEERVLEMVAAALALDTAPLPGTAPTVRYPAELPPHFHVSLTRNPRFAGRGGVIEDIRNRLITNEPHGGRLALTGLPGVGKTQAALEYVYRFAASYDGVWWISAAEQSRARVALANIAPSLGLPETGVEQQLAAVLAAFRMASPVRRWLVVLDNVESPADMAGLLPTGPGHLIVTSRDPQWANTLEAVDVDVFLRRESVELLTRRVANVEVADADRLAARLGDLPLALEQASGLLATTAMTVPDYLDLLDRSTPAAIGEIAQASSEESVASTVGVAYQRLRTANPAAARLIELLAFMAPEVIPYRMISNRQLTALLAPIDATMHDASRHATLIQDIGRLGLARVDAGTAGGPESGRAPGRRGIVVHRLTQDTIQSYLSDSDRFDRSQETRSVLAEAERGDPNDRNNWATYEALRPHLEPTGTLISDRPESRQLALDMVRYLWNRGEYTVCREVAEAALGKWIPESGPDDVAVLRMRRRLALALRDLGLEDQAYAMNEDSLERLRRTLGDQDPYTLLTASSFGADLRARGEYEKAAALDEQTVKGFRAALGDDQQDTLNAVNNLAVSLRFVGDFQRAADLDRDTMQRRRELHGSEHEYTLVSVEVLGVDLIELGELRRARNLLEEGYEAFLRVYGAERYRTIRLANTYSVALRRLGELDTAARIIDQTTRTAEKIFGRRHRLTLNCRLEQADVRCAEGRIKEAHAAGEEVYADLRELRGEHHPETIAAGNDLAIFRRVDGDLERALDLAELTFERLEGQFRHGHPYTLAGMITLANARYASGLLHLAADTDAGVLQRLRKTFRDDHPTVLAAMVNWAISHRESDPEDAAETRGNALEMLATGLGPHHPSTAAARDWQRIDQDVAPFAV
ncbi:FxSxx-COOH system tetratricopeptide repeat protein [Mangrovihabitans endophyticus]|uniref:NB-ARC domain-containing protein n=1 Tax=Mangrovihabitans endophyticus TaxID=1751298 RepID=A0A8J3BRR6_9ACTN|nr:FxSxx-COOH system tetratricopeptide repeat protein [Mangrovihabitans endophyticus]GGK72226.1 hypothetical protein GCM10012284_02560 [Mangrovihabitans endophyticus]